MPAYTSVTVIDRARTVSETKPVTAADAIAALVGAYGPIAWACATDGTWLLRWDDALMAIVAPEVTEDLAGDHPGGA